MSNADNPKIGADFQRHVLNWFQHHYKGTFELEKKLPIGKPAKDHKFDIVSTDNMIAIECKRYTWTKTGNVPSAKMGFTNEAAFYLSFLPDTYVKYIVMLYSYHEKRKETLAEYYYRTNRHLLGKTRVAEYDPLTGQLRMIEAVQTEWTKQDEAPTIHNVFSKDEVIQATAFLQKREKDIAKYCELIHLASETNVAENKDFQKAFTAFYRLRRDDSWREYYFQLFEEMKNRRAALSFGEIQLRLYLHCDQIESSFSSKMLATLDPEVPMWDSYVLKKLGFKLKGKNKGLRLSQAVVLYDNICSWYHEFLQTEEARSMIEAFDQAFPEYTRITQIKKIDFLIWGMRSHRE